MSEKSPSVTKKAILAALIGHSFWGLSFMASRIALGVAPVTVLLSHRFLLAFALMSLLLLTPLGDCHLHEKKLWPMLLLGVMEPVVYFFGEQYGILHSSTIFSGVMIALIPIASTLAAIPLLHERPNLRQILCSALSVGGVVGVGLLTKNSGSLDWIGVVGLLVAVFSAVAYSLLNRGFSASYTPFERTYSMIGVGAIVFTALSLLSLRGDFRAYLSPLYDRSYLLSMLFLAVCCSVVSYFLSSYVLTGLTIARATVFANLTTAVSVFAGAVLLHEPFSLWGLLCCAVILFGIYGVQRAAEDEKEER